MANNLRVFNTNSEYQSADLILPAVSYVVETDKVIYDLTPPTPPVFQGKWKATYSDSSVTSAECDSSSEIAYREINGRRLTSVEIGDCVTSIGQQAFEDYSGLTSIVIPDSVTSIGNSAFGRCSGLTSCTIGSGVTTIGDYAFAYCSGLTSVTIGSGVTSIGGSAFEGCRSLTGIDIPDSVTSIGNGAFRDCRSLTSINIPDSVKVIGNSAFRNCTSLTSITVEATTPPTLANANAFNNTNNCPIYVPSQSVNAYKTASGWSSYASRIQAIP